MLVFIKDIRLHADIVIVSFSTGYDAYLTFTMYENSISVTINNTNMKNEYMVYVSKLIEMIYDDILVNYINLLSNEQTYYALLSEVGEYITHLKYGHFKSITPDTINITLRVNL